MIRIDSPEIQDFEIKHIEQVRKLGAECMVLLEYDGSIPLKKESKIALFGSGARNTIKGGTGSGDVYVRKTVSIEEGLKNAGFEIATNDWLDSYDELIGKTHKEWVEQIKREAKEKGIHSVLYSLGKIMPEPDYSFSLESDADTAIYVLSRISGEGSDREMRKGDIYLTDTEVRDINYLNERYKKFVLLLNVGGYVDLSPLKDIKNIILIGQTGLSIGDTVADIISGRNYPSGRLAMTWAKSIDDYPSTVGFADPSDTIYSEGVYVGYRYFTSKEMPVAYPFGYGLSYTNFIYKMTNASLDGKTLNIRVEVENAGLHNGKEVIQVYCHKPEGKIDKPYLELIDFKKTGDVDPNSKTELSFSIDVSKLASFDEKRSEYVLEKGKYVIFIGTSSIDNDALIVINVEDTVTIEKVKPLERRANVSEIKMPYRTIDSLDAVEFSLDVRSIETKTNKYEGRNALGKTHEAFSFNQVVSKEKTIDDFISGLTDRELSTILVGHHNIEDSGKPQSVVGAAGQEVPGSAGETSGHLLRYDVPKLIMADGPAGLRLNQMYKHVNGVSKAYSETNIGAEFLSDEEREFIKLMRPPVSDEEKKAPTYYQYCVAIPVGTAIAQSFSEEVAIKCGNMVGEEMEIFGIHLWLAPAMNIQRNPLCGRNFEYYSEDPLVSGIMASGITKGVQSHKGCSTVIKHYAANNQETNRNVSNSVVSERALREIYLKGFEICVKESNPGSLMTSLNLINGEHACSSFDLLTSVLRDEWGFKGFAMTDWFITSKAIAKSMVGSRWECSSASACIKGGNDLVMPGESQDIEDIMSALADEKHPYHLSRVDLETCARRILQKVLDLRN